MLTCHKLDNVEAAADYYCRSQEQRKENAQASYYAEGNGAFIATWQPGAAALGFRGELTRDSLTLALMGCDEKGKPLVQGGGTEKHQPGMDFTYSVPKDVSLAYAAGNAEERAALMEHMQAANAKMLEALGELAIVNRGHAGAEKMGAKSLVIATVCEVTNRYGEIQIHFHNVIANVCVGDDGKTSCLDFHDMVKHHKDEGITAHADLMHRLKEDGYEIRSEVQRGVNGYETGEVFHHLAKVSQFARDDNSQRTKDIEERMAATGCSSEEANRALKKGKEEKPLEEALAETKAKIEGRAELYGFISAEKLKGDNHQLLTDTDAQILDRLHGQNNYFTARDVKREISRRRGPSLGGEGIKEETARFIQENDLLPLQSNEHGEQRWASRAQANLEREMMEVAAARSLDKSTCLKPELVESTIARIEKQKGQELSKTQREAVMGICTEDGKTGLLVGRAGAGKTTSVVCVVESFKEAGGKVYGACTANEAAAKLQSETGAQSVSTVKLLGQLDQGRIKLEKSDLVILDEAGMVGTKTIHRLQEHCKQSGATFMMLGDDKQLNAIEAGSPFAALIAGGKVNTHTLGEIWRQNKEEDRALVYSIYEGKTGKALREQMEKTLPVQIFTGDNAREARNGAINAAAKDYAAAERSDPIICPTNAEVAAANAAVRRELQEAGKLSREGVSTRGMSADGKHRVNYEVAIGERLRFGGMKDANGEKINNNAAGVVMGFENENKDDIGHQRFMRVRLEDGHTRTVDLSDKKQGLFLPAYAMTVHKSQGQTLERPLILLASGSKEADLGQVLVTLSRHKDTAKVYATEAGLDAFEKRAEGFQKKENVQDLTQPALSFTSRLSQAFQRRSAQQVQETTHAPQQAAQEPQQRRAQSQSWSMEQ